jgi:hypothetical protein
MSEGCILREYHLICRTTGESHGGFETLAGARQFAREENLETWDIFHGNLLVERHEPVSDRSKGEPIDRGCAPAPTR